MAILPESVHVCAACPRAQGRSCCEVRGDERLATLTGGDIARVRAATGRPERFFVEREPFSPEEAHAYAQLRPANADAVIGGVRRHLRSVAGACVFHRVSTGCILPAEARPLMCRLYPVELSELDQPRLAPVGSCHAADRLDGLPEVMEALGLTLTELRRLHRQVLAELRADARSAGA